jgi:drug/metabolite transporter (DMT)-like permease
LFLAMKISAAALALLTILGCCLSLKRFQIHGVHRTIAVSQLKDLHMKSSINDNEQAAGLPPTPTPPFKLLFPSELTLEQSRGLLLAIAAAYGTNFVAVKVIGDALEPSFASLLRFILSTVVFLPNVVKYRERGDILQGGAVIGISNFLGYTGQAVALNEGLSASAVAFICSLAVVVVPALDALLPQAQEGRGGGGGGGGESILQKQQQQGVGTLMPFVPSIFSALGVGFLTEFGIGGGAGDIGAGEGSSSTLAYAAAFLQPTLFGWSYWRQPQLIRGSCSEPGHYGAFTGSSLAAVTLGTALWWVVSGSSGSGSGSDSGVMAIVPQVQEAVSSPSTLLALLWTGIFTTAGCCFLESLAMKQLTGAESTLIYSTEPLFATVFGYFLLREAIGSNTYVGAAFILGAIYLSTRLEGRNEEQ